MMPRAALDVYGRRNAGALRLLHIARQNRAIGAKLCIGRALRGILFGRVGASRIGRGCGVQSDEAQWKRMMLACAALPAC